MGGSYKNKSISTDYAVFLNTFLIISTVIVFAVLVFISYQNMSNQYLNETMVESSELCLDVMRDYTLICDKYQDVEERDSLIEMYLNSDYLSDKGAIYIVDSDANIVYSGFVPVFNDEHQGSIKLAVVSAANGFYQDYKEVTGTRSVLVTAEKIGDSGLFVVLITNVDFTKVIENYVNIIIFPVLISLVTAIALFIGFTGLTMRPLRNISSTIARVSEGDLTARVDEKYTQTGDSTGMLTLSSDLTDMARDVNSMIEVLENQENDRAIFISSVAHDIRTPLTSINGFVTAMTDGTIPPELHEKYLMRIKSEVDKIRSLVVSMTEASSLSHVDPQLMESFDFKEAVEDMMLELEPQFRAKHIVTEVRIDEEGGTTVYGEIQMLCRVLLNIVTNAIKFTPEEGRIIISSYLDKKDKVRMIAVEDSGPGVEPEKRSRVFESFYKADPSRKQEGFGLGLYICKQILMGHGQSIRLDESSELGGAMFVFSFPTAPEKGNS